MEDLGLLGKRKSDEGLTALLGAYGSEEDEEEPQQSPPKKLKTVEVKETILDVASGDTLVPASTNNYGFVELVTDNLDQEPENEKTAADKAPSKPDSLRESAEPEEQALNELEKDPYWLPAEIAEPPDEPCSADIQEIVSEYIAKQEETGKTITAALKQVHGYKNPDFLQHCVKHDKIEQYGSCYPPAIFDPFNLPREDYYERLAAEWNEYCARKEQERNSSQRIDFQKGTVEQPVSRPLLTGGSATGKMAADMLALARQKADAAKQGRSKWDAKAR